MNKEELMNILPHRDHMLLVDEAEVIDGVKEYLESLNYFDEILITRAGGVISSHCGPGTLGVLFVQGR